MSAARETEGRAQARRARRRATQLTLLSRAWCHLCDEMHAALAPLARRHGAKVVVVDVDDHPALEAAHGDRVPVLFLGTPTDGVELCHYHLDERRVEAALADPARASKIC